MYYYVEQAVDFTNEYGDISDPFYTATETAYEDALKLISTHNLKDHFLDRYIKIRHQTQDIG